MSRPLKHLGSGALQELATLDVDYVAFKAGLHLGRISSSDASALTLVSGGDTVGQFDDTHYESSVGAVPGTYWTVTFTA